ncbi:MAG: hypothetical protein GWO07_05930, partial [Candidatus Dadabacteria bacterium]|nr:hypothetical protein [Candidatus Dadabacteria bacterium]NIS08294.1 hypothetical protein [Candidatus Dadabacteria bacterium]NIV12159.1 hypothetical protein [Fodinibius sp.]NIY21813.1 hypothetical protein [Candidatus Dadabacteria bacterium]
IYDEINNRRDRAKFPIYTALYLLWGSDKHYNYIKGVLKGVIKNWYLPDGTKKIFKRQSNKNPESEQDQLIEELFINLSGKRYDKAIEKEELEVALIGGTKYINYIPNALKYRFKDKIYT